MNKLYVMSPDADRDTLIQLHNDILRRNPSIRVMNRWGYRSEYSLKMKRHDAADILDLDLADDTRVWKLDILLERRTGGQIQETLSLSYYDPKAHRWLEMSSPEISDRATRWLGARYPAVEVLTEIDRTLLLSLADGQAA